MDCEEGYELWAEARGMRLIEGLLIGMEREKTYVKKEKWIKRSGTKYEQRPGIWAVLSIDGLIRERQNWYDKTEKWIERRGTKYGQRPGRWAVSSIDELVWGRQIWYD